ncbi:MAG: hypothetical protein WBC60_17400 [Cognaticolwellia sp.]
MSGANHHDVDNLDLPFWDTVGELKQVIINDNVWVGTHAVIMNHINEGTAVGAGSVVTRTFPKNMIIGGVPARVIRARGEKK